MKSLQPQMLDKEAMAQARARWDAVAKPLHALGRLEDLLVQAAGIQGTPDVALLPRCALVFCGDHGVVEEGVSQSRSDVTAKVARAIAQGVSNVNLMAEAVNAQVWAVDMGMAEPLVHPRLLNRSQDRGTRNMAREPAMTRVQAQAAVQAGIDLVGEQRAQGRRMIAVGEMGIGNTTAATALTCALLRRDPEELTGRGAGLSDEGLRRKREAIRRALSRNQPDPNDPMDCLAKVGGLEIAGMAGAFLGGMAHRVPMVMDGVICAAAALVAVRLCPACRDFILPSHRSREPAMGLLLDALGLEPMVCGDLALGEGTGALTLFPLMDMAQRVYAGPHTFDSLDMAAYVPQGGKS